MRTALSGRQTRADYVFRLGRVERFTCAAKKPSEVLHDRHIYQAKRDAFARGLPLATNSSTSSTASPRRRSPSAKARVFRARMDGPHEREYCYTYLRNWLYTALRRTGWKEAELLPPKMWAGHPPLREAVPPWRQWRYPRAA